ERLFKKIDGSELHRLDGEGDIAMSGDDHDWKTAIQRFHALEKLDTVDPGHAYVGDHTSKVEVRKHFEKICSAFKQRDLEIGGIEQEAERIAHRRIIIDDVDLWHAQPASAFS